MKINKNSKWLNDSNFLEEGEYIIEKQPKYKYEIKIHHDYSKEKEMNKFKSKTPDKIKFVHKYSNKKNSYKNHFIKNIRPENIAQLHFFCHNNQEPNHFKYNKCDCEKKLYNIIKECVEKIENEKKLEINKKYQKNKKIIHFKGPLKIEKQNRFYYHSLFNKIQYHISDINLKNSTNINNNNNIIYITSHRNNYKKNKNIYHTPDKNLFYKKKLFNQSFNSNDILENIDQNNKSTIMNYANTERNNIISKESMIHKSSETKEVIKQIPLGQKINPLIIRKKVYKPILEVVKKYDVPKRKVIKQASILTSIKTNPLYLNNNNNTSRTIYQRKGKLVKESTTNIYTMLIKNINGYIYKKRNTKLLNKSFDNIHNIKKSQNGFSYRSHINNKSIKRKKYLQKSQNFFNYLNNRNNNNKNLLDINHNNINNINNSLIIFSSINSNMYEPIETNNTIRIKEIIKHLKYLYYRCTHLNTKIENKLDSLTNYFLNLSDEEKIGILTHLKNNGEEDEKIYKKLIEILKEKRKTDESLNMKLKCNI